MLWFIAVCLLLFLLLWPPCGIGQAITFSCCGFFLSSYLFFPRLISAVEDWMSTILRHMVCPSANFRMQVWNVLRVARWKYRTQKSCQKSQSRHHCTTLSGYIFATKAHIDNQKNFIKQQYLLLMSPQYGELRPTSGWDRSDSLGHPCKFQRVSPLGSVTARHCSSGRQPKFAASNRGRQLRSAGRPSGWALAHILVSSCFLLLLLFYFLA